LVRTILGWADLGGEFRSPGRGQAGKVVIRLTRDRLIPRDAFKRQGAIWHILQEEWRLLLVTLVRDSARMKL